MFTIDLGTNLDQESVGRIQGTSWLLALYACCASLREEPVYTGACVYETRLMSLVGVGSMTPGDILRKWKATSLAGRPLIICAGDSDEFR